MSQRRASHGRTRTKTGRSHAKTRSARARIIAAAGAFLVLGGAVALTLQSGSDGSGAAASGKPQGQESVSDRVDEAKDTGVRPLDAEESEAAAADEQRMVEEEEQKARIRAAETARENQQEAAQKREAAEAEAEAREKTAREKQQPKKERAAAATGGGGSDSGGLPSTGMSADEHRLISLLNGRRAALGLPPVEESADLAGQAEDCSARSLEAGALEHCGHEVLFMGGSGNTPEAMIDAWFNSPGHKTALTYESSAKAGAAIVVNSAGRLVAAINIDY